jgi:steroid delta-isomerase-like uncharacterized protein
MFPVLCEVWATFETRRWVQMVDAAELGERWFQAIDAGDVDGAVSLLSDDVEFVTPAGSMKGPEEVRPFVRGYVVAFPDGKFDMTAVFGSGNAVAMEGTYSGTNSGPLASPSGEVPATGKYASIPFVTVLETDGERITAHRVYWDQVGFMGQLGLMPAPPSA